jgi:hypothetical protein
MLEGWESSIAEIGSESVALMWVCTNLPYEHASVDFVTTRTKLHAFPVVRLVG